MMEALELRMVDESYKAHLQAFLNFSVKAERKAGKYKTRPVYRKFEQFFDYEKEIDRIKNRKKTEDRIKRYVKMKKESGIDG